MPGSRAGPSRAELDRAKEERAGPGRAWLGRAGLGWAGPSRAGPDLSRPGWTGPSRSGPSRAELGRVGPNGAGPSGAGFGRAGPGWAWPPGRTGRGEGWAKPGRDGPHGSRTTPRLARPWVELRVYAFGRSDPPDTHLPMIHTLVVKPRPTPPPRQTHDRPRLFSQGLEVLGLPRKPTTRHTKDTHMRLSRGPLGKPCPRTTTHHA